MPASPYTVRDRIIINIDVIIPSSLYFLVNDAH